MPSDERASSEQRETPTGPTNTDEGERSDGATDATDDPQAATRRYPTRDRPPEGWTGTDAEWSSLSDEDKRIAVFSMLPVEERDPSILVPNGTRTRANGTGPPGSRRSDRTTADGMTAATCAEIRDHMNDALTAREVVEEHSEFHTSKIMRHAYGECNHDSVDVPATASPQIAPDECLSMRDDYRGGESVAAIASTWARSENTVTRHIFGRCSHDPRPRAVAPSEVGVEECDRIRRTFEGNEKVSVREVACAMRLRREVVATHLFDYCRHVGKGDHRGPDVAPADPDTDRLWDGRNA